MLAYAYVCKTSDAIQFGRKYNAWKQEVLNPLRNKTEDVYQFKMKTYVSQNFVREN